MAATQNDITKLRTATGTTAGGNDTGWWDLNGGTVVQTAGSVLTGIFGNGGLTTGETNYEYGVTNGQKVNWLGIVLGLAIVGGLGYIVYKAVKK